MGTSLFHNDSATVNDLLPAVNANIGDRQGGDEEEFEKEEAVAGLKRLAEANAIMYLEEQEEVYRL